MWRKFNFHEGYCLKPSHKLKAHVLPWVREGNLDDAGILAWTSQLRLIHGKGKGNKLSFPWWPFPGKALKALKKENKGFSIATHSEVMSKFDLYSRKL